MTTAPEPAAPPTLPAPDETDVVLLEPTQIDPDVADKAAEEAKKRAKAWTRRHDIDYENGRP